MGYCTCVIKKTSDAIRSEVFWTIVGRSVSGIP